MVTAYRRRTTASLIDQLAERSVALEPARGRSADQRRRWAAERLEREERWQAERLNRPTNRVFPKEQPLIKPKKRKQKPVPEQPYLEYLKSTHWLTFKLSYFGSHERKCAGCDSRRVDLHHRTYERLGREQESDVVPVCRFHHAGCHEYAGRNPDLTLEEATQQYLERI